MRQWTEGFSGGGGGNSILGGSSLTCDSAPPEVASAFRKGLGWSLAADAPATIGPWLRQTAQRNGSRPAIEAMGETASYEELDFNVDRLAAGLLLELDLSSGEAAAVMMRNSLACVDVWFAMARSGVVDVPVNVAQQGDGLRYVLSQSRSKAVFCDAEFLGRLAEAASELPELRHVVVHRPLGEDAGSASPPLGFAPGVTLHELTSLYLDKSPRLPRLQPQDTAVILYTSGTTGPPKGAMLSHCANLTLARHTRWLMGYDSSDVLYTAFPLFHINARYTTVMCALDAGARCVLEQRFSAGGFWDVCRRKGVTAFNYMGALIMMLWKQPRRPDDRDNPVRRGFGAPCPLEVWEAFEERFGVRLTEVYGSTEVPIVVQNGMAAASLADRVVGSAGLPSGLYDLRVADPDGVSLPAGQSGEILVRPRREGVAFSGYFDMPEATAEAWRGGWFHTGDRGVIGEDARLSFIDRMKDCVRRRGENISSYEVEQTICRHPAVLEAAVVGVPSELSEEEVLACVVLKSGERLSAAELVEFCRGRMADFAVPRYVRWMSELPRNASQRVQKFLLRSQGLTPDVYDTCAAGSVAGAGAAGIGTGTGTATASEPAP